MDIFKGLLWYTYRENRAKWYKLTLEQVQEIISANKNKEVVASLEDYESEIIEVEKKEFEDLVGQDSLTRFDVPKSRKKRKSRSKKPQNVDSNQQPKVPKNQGHKNQKQQQKMNSLRS